MPLNQNLKTSEDVSYAASSLSGAEILGVFPSLALWETKSPEFCQKRLFHALTGGLRLIRYHEAWSKSWPSVAQGNLFHK